MNSLIPMLRLPPQAAGEQGRSTKATSQLQDLMRFRKEFDRQLAVLIGNDAVRKMNKHSKNALLLADLVKEAA